MSLPDGAVYWNDVKSHFGRPRFVPVHSSKYPCKQALEFSADPKKQVNWRRKLVKITCKHCIRNIPEEIIEDMKREIANTS